MVAALVATAEKSTVGTCRHKSVPGSVVCIKEAPLIWPQSDEESLAVVPFR